VPGSLHIPRTVLEWRLDPDSAWRNPHAGGLDQELVLICDHGCSSLLAAATPADLGFTRVGDIIGGFAAWREATCRWRSRAPRTAPRTPRPACDRPIRAAEVPTALRAAQGRS
jgi:Rhodanese-like domain